ncbi:MAG: hydroxymethylbilane synthase, partial [Nannocystaceae bacterium]|nr:hydroxymethylbilane synthase [Nannocystaceae bacterium]
SAASDVYKRQVPIRGNVPTRVGLVDQGEVDVVILAAAGLRRLGMGDRISEVLGEDAFLPAPAQGILALQCRSDDSRVRELLAALVDADTTVRAAAERGFLVRLEASCTVPLACYATLCGDRLSVRGMVVDPSGEPCYEASREGSREEAAEIGTALAEDLLGQGAGAILERH